MGIQTENHRSMGKSEEISQICLGRDSDGDSMRKIAKFCLFLSKDKNYGVTLYSERCISLCLAFCDPPQLDGHFFLRPVFIPHLGLPFFRRFLRFPGISRFFYKPAKRHFAKLMIPSRKKWFSRTFPAIRWGSPQREPFSRCGIPEEFLGILRNFGIAFK